jgi:hypothetical protein
MAMERGRGDDALRLIRPNRVGVHESDTMLEEFVIYSACVREAKHGSRAAVQRPSGLPVVQGE